jgi:type I restriction enzyme S subunit
VELTPGYKQTEVGMIPEEWEVVSIGSLASFKSGEGINVAELSEESSDAPIPVYGGNGIAGYTATALVAEQVVVVGRVGQKCGEVYLTKGPAWITDNALYPRILFRKLDVSFLALALKAAGLNNVKNRNDLPLVTQSILHSVRIPIPPKKAEQEAIAEALSDADALTESLEQLIAKKRHLKQGMMQELLTGKKRLPGFSREWQQKKLGELGESLIGLTYEPRSVKSAGLLVLRSSNIFQEALRFEDNVFVDMQVPEAIILRKGDILICVRNGSRDLIGKCALINEEAQGMTFGAFMAVFRTPFYDFAYHQFRSNLIKRQINEHLGATINQITNKSLNSFQIPFPTDEKERAAIAAILNDLDAEIVAAEGKLAKARQLKHGMMQELLTGRTRLV